MLGGLACAADAGAGFQAQAHEAGCGGGEWSDESAGGVETVQQGAAGGGDGLGTGVLSYSTVAGSPRNPACW
jgi:hypothetical protein